MKSHEFTRLDEKSMMLDKLKSYAKTHYSDTENETEALLLLFARSLKHAEEDDRRQDKQIDDLKSEIGAIKSKHNKVTTPKSNNQIKSMGPINQNDLKSPPKL